MIAVETTDLSITHSLAETPAVQQLSLRLEAGKVYGFVGRNGSGKTTLFHALRGLIPGLLGGTVEGKVEILGDDISRLGTAELASRVGLVFENPYTQLTGARETVVEEIAFGLENLGWSRADIIDRTAEVLSSTGLEDLAFRDPLELSGGQRQRVSFASIIAMKSPVLLIDEPTSQLDPWTTEQIFSTIQGLRGSGTTVLLAENKIDELVRAADEIVILDRGQLVFAGPAEAAFQVAEAGRLECGFPEPYRMAKALDVEPRWLVPADAISALESDTHMVGEAR